MMTLFPLWASLIPMSFALLGGLLGHFFAPKAKLSSFLECFTAGIVIGAAACELLPQILQREGKTPTTIALGFIAGTLFMYLLHFLSHFFGEEHPEKGKKPLSFGLLGASGLDLIVDGLLIPIAFLVSARSALFIALSLSPCAFFLSLSVASLLKKRAHGWHYGLLPLLAAMLPLGAFIGSLFVETLPQSLLEEILAAAVAALLYLGIEELLLDPHGEKKPPFSSLAFFAGFLVVFWFKA